MVQLHDMGNMKLAACAAREMDRFFVFNLLPVWASANIKPFCPPIPFTMHFSTSYTYSQWKVLSSRTLFVPHPAHVSHAPNSYNFTKNEMYLLWRYYQKQNTNLLTGSSIILCINVPSPPSFSAFLQRGVAYVIGFFNSSCTWAATFRLRGYKWMLDIVVFS